MSRPRCPRASLCFASAFMAAACATAPVTSAPSALDVATDWPKVWLAAPDSIVSQNIVEADNRGWLARLEDAELERLVMLALAENPSLDVTRLRLEQARARTRQAEVARLPLVSGSLSGQTPEATTRSDNAPGRLDYGLGVSWEADLWGRIDADINAARLSEDAAVADLSSARLLLAAAVAEAYFLAIEAEALSILAERNVSALEETLGFVSVQFDRGLRSGQDLSLIRTDVASAKADLIQRRNSARDRLRDLEILTGSYPDAMSAVERAPAAIPDIPFLPTPLEILSLRPDLSAAYRRVMAAESVAATVAAGQKPRLGLSGILLGGGTSLADAFRPDAIALTLLGQLTDDLFTGGRDAARLDSERAETEVAYAQYRDLALTAVREVEELIDLGSVLMEREAELDAALLSARDTLRFTRFRYESAETDLLNVLSVQQRVFSIEAQLAAIRRARAVQYVSLNTALGTSYAQRL